MKDKIQQSDRNMYKLAVVEILTAAKDTSLDIFRTTECPYG